MKHVYLDFAAAAPLEARVARVIRQAEKRFWQNASALYESGAAASAALASYRKQIADLLFCHPEEIIFTAGGTESNNLAILGVKPRLALSSSIDHPSVLETIKAACPKYFFLPVSQDGHIDLKVLKEKLNENPSLLSFSYVNSEIGTIENVRGIMKVVRLHRKEKKTPYPYVHLDASAASPLPIKVNELGVDLMTLSGAKSYGLKGIALLYIKRGVKLEPIIHGGGQERGLRSGTENLPAIAGLAKALAIEREESAGEYKRLQKLQKKFFALVKKTFPQAVLNGPAIGDRHPANLNFCFPHTDSEQATIILDAKGVAVSPSTSCQNLAARSNSYVVLQLGKDRCAQSSLRFSFGRGSSEKDFKYVIEVLKEAVKNSTSTRIRLS